MVAIARALAPKTKTHIRNLMHLLYENARRWELIERNPIELVRQSSRQLHIPRVLRPYRGSARPLAGAEGAISHHGIGGGLSGIAGERNHRAFDGVISIGGELLPFLVQRSVVHDEGGGNQNGILTQGPCLWIPP